MLGEGYPCEGGAVWLVIALDSRIRGNDESRLFTGMTGVGCSRE